MRRTGVGIFALLAVAVYAPSAAAQVCAGFPTLDRQFSFGASLGFPDEGDRYGVEASYNVQGPAAVFGGLQIDSPEGEGDSNDTFFAGGSFDLMRLPMGSDSLIFCPTARVGYSSNDFFSTLSVPIGIGIGTTISLTPAAQLMPYVVPQIVMNRYSPEGGGESETNWDFGIRGGAMVGVGMFFIGAEIDHIFVDGADAQFGIRAGIRL